MFNLSYEEIIDLIDSIRENIISIEKDIRNYQSLMACKKYQPEQIEAGEKLIVLANIKIERLEELLDKLNR